MSLARITYINYPHLVIAYAADDLILFKDEEDYYFYIDLLKEMVKEGLIVLYSFCLTEKELRIVIKPIKITLAKIMQKLHVRFSKYINKKFSHKGKLFASRFFSILFLEKDLLKIISNVHLWPVRSRLVKRAELYKFSTQKVYTGEHIWDFIAYTEILSLLGKNLDIQKKAYNKFLESVILEPDNICISYSLNIANNKKNTKEYSIEALAQNTCLFLGVAPQNILLKSRKQNLVMARRMLATICVLGFNISSANVAKYLNLDKAQISRLISQGMELLKNNQPFINIFNSITLEDY